MCLRDSAFSLLVCTTCAVLIFSTKEVSLRSGRQVRRHPSVFFSFDVGGVVRHVRFVDDEKDQAGYVGVGAVAVKNVKRASECCYARP